MRFFVTTGIILLCALFAIASGVHEWGDHPFVVAANVAVALLTIAVMVVNIRLEIIARRARAIPLAACKAVERARELLLRLLTPQQREEYLERSSITIQTDKARYTLSPRKGLFAFLNGAPMGLETHSLCIQFRPRDQAHLPEEDRLIAILLMIRTDEAGLWERFCHPFNLLFG